MSTTPSKKKRQKVDEGLEIKVQAWALELAQQADLDGTFPRPSNESRPTLLSADALMKASHEVNGFSTAKITSLKQSAGMQTGEPTEPSA